MRLRRRDIVGKQVVDSEGTELGRVADTWPHDGGGETEMMLVTVGRFGRRRYLPLEGVRASEEHVRVPWTKLEIEDGPDAEDQRWGSPALVARSHWAMFGDD